MENIHDQREDNDATKHNHAPVERVRRVGSGPWPERPEESKGDVCQAEDIDWDAPLSKTPAPPRDEFWVGKAAIENAGN